MFRVLRTFTGVCAVGAAILFTAGVFASTSADARYYRGGYRGVAHGPRGGAVAYGPRGVAARGSNGGYAYRSNGYRGYRGGYSYRGVAYGPRGGAVAYGPRGVAIRGPYNS